MTTADQISQTTARFTVRPYRYEDDFWRVRNLLIEAFPITGPGFNWEIRHWDGNHFHDADLASNMPWRNRITLWETEDGTLAGAVHDEGALGYPQLQIHPDYRAAIEADLIAWAEDHLAGTTEDGRRFTCINVYEYDFPRLRLLAERGYEKLADSWVHRRMYFGRAPLPEPVIAKGYTLRTVDHTDPAECDRIAALLNAAFGRTFHKGEDFAAFARQAPCFRRDLHLVAVAPDGSFAAHVGTIYDEANRRALYEPVCTHPDHRRHGLAQALMFEGMRRVRALGAAQITVETGDAIPANRLYESIGFTEAYKGYAWQKVW